MTYRDEDTVGTEHDGDLYLEMLNDRRYLTFYDANFHRLSPTTKTSPSGTDHGPANSSCVPRAIGTPPPRPPCHMRESWAFQGIGVPFVTWLGVSRRGIEWSRVGLDLQGREPRLPALARGLEREFDACITKLTGTNL